MYANVVFNKPADVVPYYGATAPTNSAIVMGSMAINTETRKCYLICFDQNEQPAGLDLSTLFSLPANSGSMTWNFISAPTQIIGGNGYIVTGNPTPITLSVSGLSAGQIFTVVVGSTSAGVDIVMTPQQQILYANWSTPLGGTISTVSPSQNISVIAITQSELQPLSMTASWSFS